MTLQILRKASVAIVNSLGKGGFKEVKEKRLVMRAYGTATGFELGQTGYGEYIAFKGEFRVINEDGEESAAPKLFLVAPADELLKQALGQADGKPVNFGFDIFIVPDEGSERGYQYRVANLLEIKASDPVAALGAQISPFPGKPKQQPLLAAGTEAESGPLLAGPTGSEAASGEIHEGEQRDKAAAEAEVKAEAEAKAARDAETERVAADAKSGGRKR